MPTPGPMALAGGNGRVVASGRPFDRQPDARGKRAVVDSGRPRHRAEGTPQPCLRVTGAISSAVHPPCRSDCVVRTLKLGPVRPVRPAITARLRHRVSFTRGRSLVHHDPGARRPGCAPALARQLVASGALAPDQTIFEFGCGTGRLAARLLGTLPPDVTYIGVDISPVMINLATRRLAAWAQRATAVLVDGSLPLPAGEGCADRVLSTFVFDLLDADCAHAVLDDLRRILTLDGLICLASLTHGHRLLERAISGTWTRLWRMAPQLVGGCRPIDLSALLGHDWQSRITHVCIVGDS